MNVFIVHENLDELPQKSNKKYCVLCRPIAVEMVEKVWNMRLNPESSCYHLLPQHLIDVLPSQTQSTSHSPMKKNNTIAGRKRINDLKYVVL